MSRAPIINIPPPSTGRASLTRTSRVPTQAPVRTKLGQRSVPQPARPAAVPRPTVDLTLSAPTGPQTVTCSLNRQDAPPLAYEMLKISQEKPPIVPADAPKIEVRSVGRTPLTNAYNNAAAGSVINVPAGTYKESLKVEKDLHFIATGEVVVASDTVSDTIKAVTNLVTFEGFTFTQDESQASFAAIIESGTAVFKNCNFRSNHTVTIVVKNDAKCYFINCTIQGGDTTAMMVNQQATVVANNCKFSAPKANCVLVRGQSTSCWTKCTVEEVGRNGFMFSDSAEFLFENSTISKPIEVTAQTRFGMFKNCTIEGMNLRMSQNATPYFVGCTFNKVSLECKDTCGVRLIQTKFYDQEAQPGLMVYGDATVAMNECEFRRCRAGAACACYKNGSLKIADTKFTELSGVGLLGFGSTCDLAIEKCVFGGIATSGAVIHSGAQFAVKECLFDRVGGAGLLLDKAGKIEISSSKFSGCALSGIEVNNTEDVNIDHCIFEGNTQCGFIATEADNITIRECDFAKNRMTGIDLRECKNALIHGSIVVDNCGGGMAFRNNTTVTVEEGGVGNNQQYGIASYTNAVVTTNKVNFIENDIAVLATAGSEININEGEVSDHASSAVVADGNNAEIKITKTSFVHNKVAVQILGGAEVLLDETKMSSNGVHVEVYDNSILNVRSAKFQQSRSGIGVSVLDNSRATFTDKCNFVDEAKAAIISCAECNVSGATISDCGTCGLYYYENGTGEVKDCLIARNGACGVQIMGGSVTCTDNTFEGHTAFGIHVQPEATVQASNNQFIQNSMGDINYEKD